MVKRERGKSDAECVRLCKGFRETAGSAARFSHRIKWIIQKIRHHGLFYTKKKVTLSTGEEELLYDRLEKRVTNLR